jgi:hypothetical protein
MFAAHSAKVLVDIPNVIIYDAHLYIWSLDGLLIHTCTPLAQPVNSNIHIMAAPIRHTFSKATLGSLAPGVPGAVAAASPAAITEIRLFALTMTALLPFAQAADAAGAQTSTRALYDSMELHRSAFRKALAACTALVRATPAWAQANQAVTQMYQAWHAAVALLPTGVGAYVMNPNAINWPTESPLELIYETVLNALALPNFGTCNSIFYMVLWMFLFPHFSFIPANECSQWMGCYSRHQHPWTRPS